MGESTKLNSLETFRLFLFLLSRPHCLRKSPFAPLSKSYTLKMSGESMDTDQKTYGGCEGPDAMYVKLISSDGHEFIVKRDHALTSGTIKAMLSGPGQFSENETNEVNFREIPSHVLQKVCMYFTYKCFLQNLLTMRQQGGVNQKLAQVRANLCA